MKNVTRSQNEKHAIPGISELGESYGEARRGLYGCHEISEYIQNNLNDNLRNTNILLTNVKSCFIVFFPWVCFLGPVLLFEYVEKYVLIAFISLSLVLYFLSVKMFRVAYDMVNGPLRKICIYYFYILIFVPGISILWYIINIGTLTMAVENVACARFDPDFGKHVIKPFGIALLYLISSYACGYYYSHSVFLSFLFVYYIIRGLFYKEFPSMFYFAFYILSSVVIVSILLGYIQFVPEFLPSLLTMCGVMYGLFLRECYDFLSKAKRSIEGDLLND